MVRAIVAIVLPARACIICTRSACMGFIFFFQLCLFDIQRAQATRAQPSLHGIERERARASALQVRGAGTLDVALRAGETGRGDAIHSPDMRLQQQRTEHRLRVSAVHV